MIYFFRFFSLLFLLTHQSSSTFACHQCLESVSRIILANFLARGVFMRFTADRIQSKALLLPTSTCSFKDKIHSMLSASFARSDSIDFLVLYSLSVSKISSPNGRVSDKSSTALSS